VPETGLNRIKSFVSNRGDWCISRQRSWGVPIPVFYDKATGKEVLLDEHTIKHIQSIFSEQGSDAWWKLDEIDLLPEKYKGEADQWVKGTDTMDVWFDSGSSWAGVCSERSEELGFPADLYLEGSDQHRGWFQSSLLTSVAVNSKAPYKAVLTHGFVLDEKVSLHSHVIQRTCKATSASSQPFPFILYLSGLQNVKIIGQCGESDGDY
jgi:isoleucyl-tRNA synthetase